LRIPQLITTLSDENEVDGITIIDAKLIEGPGGNTKKYLVQCWISEKHMELFSELMRMS
jgi:hypothetical protein